MVENNYIFARKKIIFMGPKIFFWLKKYFFGQKKLYFISSPHCFNAIKIKKSDIRQNHVFDQLKSS